MNPANGEKNPGQNPSPVEATFTSTMQPTPDSQVKQPKPGIGQRLKGLFVFDQKPSTQQPSLEQPISTTDLAPIIDTKPQSLISPEAAAQFAYDKNPGGHPEPELKIQPEIQFQTPDQTTNTPTNLPTETETQVQPISDAINTIPQQEIHLDASSQTQTFESKTNDSGIQNESPITAQPEQPANTETSGTVGNSTESVNSSETTPAAGFGSNVDAKNPFDYPTPESNSQSPSNTENTTTDSNTTPAVSEDVAVTPTLNPDPIPVQPEQPVTVESPIEYPAEPTPTNQQQNELTNNVLKNLNNTWGQKAIIQGDVQIDGVRNHDKLDHANPITAFIDIDKHTGSVTDTTPKNYNPATPEYGLSYKTDVEQPANPIQTTDQVSTISEVKTQPEADATATQNPDQVQLQPVEQSLQAESQSINPTPEQPATPLTELPSNNPDVLGEPQSNPELNKVESLDSNQTTNDQNQEVKINYSAPVIPLTPTKQN